MGKVRKPPALKIKETPNKQIIKKPYKSTMIIKNSATCKTLLSSKKGRKTYKKQQILKQICATQEALFEDKARAKREKTEIIKDVKPLLDALPSLNSILQYKKGKLKTGVSAYDKPKAKLEEKQRRREKKTNEFQSKLTAHKELLYNYTLSSVEQRKELIRKKMKDRQNN